MGKTEFNDEIVRMRKLVKQARVRVIHKLTREAKTLRAKKGTEKQLEKNKKKADKLINEIHFLKKLKNDNITKFGISNKKSLQEILQSKKSKVSARIMARITEHKLLKNAIIQFRDKYPDYEQHLQPGKNKSAKQNNKFDKQDEKEITVKRETLDSSEVTESLVENELNSDNQDSDVKTGIEDNSVKSEIEDNSIKSEIEDSSVKSEIEDNSVKSEIEDNNVKYEIEDNSVKSEIENNSITSETVDNSVLSKTETGDNNLFKEEQNSEEKHDSEAGSIIKTEPTISEKIEQIDSRKHLKRNRKEMTESIKEYNNNGDKNIKKARIKEEISKMDKKKETVKVISKEATVKRFVDILQEENSEENLEENSEENVSLKVNDKKFSKNKLKSEKTVDPFFISGDGNEYLSLAPSKTKENNDLSLDEDDNFYNNKRSKQYSSNKRSFANDRFFSNVKSSSEDIRGRRRRQEESQYNDNNFNRDKSLFKKQKYNNGSSFRDTKNHNKNVIMNANSNENENLHPSWAAKKKQQEILKQGFQGKKIVFDDE
ncbi:PREDICTED: serum response factor-binding protein 1-like [Polistes canadensis]|uniref:serum response factor-binding protein 1-like n=1 Tax=Polistes canadensis TaxID=91411 RepID=UPI000718B1EB|nr:PREDICTED: serum response factor-binding protein 1-like [Polistes canadensis]